MHKGLLLLIGVSLASTAFAQSQRDPVRAQAGLRGLEYDPGPSQDGYECLVRKSDGRPVCHTRDRWRQIAQRLEREEAQRRMEQMSAQSR